MSWLFQVPDSLVLKYTLVAFELPVTRTDSTYAWFLYVARTGLRWSKEGSEAWWVGSQKVPLASAVESAHSGKQRARMKQPRRAIRRTAVVTPMLAARLWLPACSVLR